MKAIITFTLFLLSFSSAMAIDESFITTKVYTYSGQNGTVVFTDKKPSNKTHQTKTITAVKATKNEPLLYQEQLIINHQYPITEYQSTPKKRLRHHSKKVKKNNANIKTCKKYKRRLDKVSEKMRVGYTAQQYRSLETKRVKYRDLLFHNCNSHDLL